MLLCIRCGLCSVSASPSFRATFFPLLPPDAHFLGIEESQRVSMQADQLAIIFFRRLFRYTERYIPSSSHAVRLPPLTYLESHQATRGGWQREQSRHHGFELRHGQALGELMTVEEWREGMKEGGRGRVGRRDGEGGRLISVYLGEIMRERA